MGRLGGVQPLLLGGGGTHVVTISPVPEKILNGGAKINVYQLSLNHFSNSSHGLEQTLEDGNLACAKATASNHYNQTQYDIRVCFTSIATNNTLVLIPHSISSVHFMSQTCFSVGNRCFFVATSFPWRVLPPWAPPAPGAPVVLQGSHHRLLFQRVSYTSLYCIQHFSSL